MKKFKCFLPGFRASCLTVCGLYVFMSGSLLIRGFQASMAEFKVPQAILASPHYLDAMTWVYSHMIVIGLMIGLIGVLAESPKLKKNFARLMFLANCFYAYLDFRSSDSFLGNGLYQGPASILPALICVFVSLIFLHLSLCSEHTSAAT